MRSAPARAPYKSVQPADGRGRILETARGGKIRTDGKGRVYMGTERKGKFWSVGTDKCKTKVRASTRARAHKRTLKSSSCDKIRRRMKAAHRNYDIKEK